MRRHNKQVLTMLMLFILIGVMYAMPAMAAPKIITVKVGKTYDPHRSDTPYYKLIVKKDGIVELDGTELDGDGFIYNKLKKQDSYYRLEGKVKGDGASGSFHFVDWDKSYAFLKKGIYYFKLDDDINGTFKINYIQKPINKSNYCMKKAISLPKNKQISVLQKGDEKYSRWYKIKLPAKRKITCITNHNYDRSNIKLYNSKGELVKTTYDEDYEKEFSSRSSLKAGTYYFRIMYSSLKQDSYDFITLKWK